MGYEIGDKVQVINENATGWWFDCTTQHITGTIKQVNDDDVDKYYVKIDGYKGIYDNGWFAFRDEHLRLINTSNKEIKTVKSKETSLYSPLVVQQSGDHYSKKGIQPIEYGLANDLSFPQVNIVKYITRHEDKNGLDDLAKSIHYHFFEALRCYGEEGSDELRNKVLKLLNIDKDVNDE